jgi:hypothetical protein
MKYDSGFWSLSNDSKIADLPNRENRENTLFFYRMGTEKHAI